MNLSELSDFEINKLVAEIEFKVLQIIKTIGQESITVIYEGDDGNDKMTPFTVDYCNNPADSWKLMVDNGIDLKLFPVSKSYCASCYDDYEIYVLEENPGRAVAICFLMIKGGE